MSIWGPAEADLEAEILAALGALLGDYWGGPYGSVWGAQLGRSRWAPSHGGTWVTSLVMVPEGANVGDYLSLGGEPVERWVPLPASQGVEPDPAGETAPGGEAGTTASFKGYAPTADAASPEVATLEELIEPFRPLVDRVLEAMAGVDPGGLDRVIDVLSALLAAAGTGEPRVLETLARDADRAALEANPTTAPNLLGSVVEAPKPAPRQGPLAWRDYDGLLYVPDPEGPYHLAPTPGSGTPVLTPQSGLLEQLERLYGTSSPAPPEPPPLAEVLAEIEAQSLPPPNASFPPATVESQTSVESALRGWLEGAPMPPNLPWPELPRPATNPEQARWQGIYEALTRSPNPYSGLPTPRTPFEDRVKSSGFREGFTPIWRKGHRLGDLSDRPIGYEQMPYEGVFKHFNVLGEYLGMRETPIEPDEVSPIDFIPVELVGSAAAYGTRYVTKEMLETAARYAAKEAITDAGEAAAGRLATRMLEDEAAAGVAGAGKGALRRFFSGEAGILASLRAFQEQAKARAKALLDSAPRTIWDNLMPEKLAQELAEAEAAGATVCRVGDAAFDQMLASGGKIKWVVTPEGDLLFVQKQIGKVEIKHPVMTAGQDVAAAGEVIIEKTERGYASSLLDNNSGHYLPDDESLELAKRVFEIYGIILP